MECPFELPMRKTKRTNNFCKLKDARNRSIAYGLTEEEADYIIQAINSHEKLVRVIEETNQCFKCKFGYRQQTLTCPGEADAELPCAGFIEKHKGLNYFEQALEAEKKE